MKWTATAIAILSALPMSARAQIAWDTPRLIGPESPRGLSVYWLRSSSIAKETDGVMATWTLPGVDGSVALRGGIGFDADDQISGFGGIDLRTRLARHTAEQPLDLEWNAGIGAGAGSGGGRYVVVTLPTGISAGRSWSSGSVWLAPYVSMGLALDLKIGDEAPDEEFTVTPAADVGLDLALDPGRRFIIRVAMSLGDRQALALGLNVGKAR